MILIIFILERIVSSEPIYDSIAVDGPNYQYDMYEAYEAWKRMYNISTTGYDYRKELNK